MKILAVDLGVKRTGLAISTPDERMALALETLEGGEANDVAAVARREGAEHIVVGLPLHMNGSVGPAAQRASEFAEELRGLVSVPVSLWDERLSTAEGEARLRGAGLNRKERARKLDTAAAIVILETFLEHRRRDVH